MAVLSYLVHRTLSRALRNVRSLQQVRFSSSAEAEKPVWTPPTEQELADEPDPFIRKEIVEYARARTRLAEMMGRDPKTFSDQDVKDAIQYLFPTSLTMKDARPFLKHPKEIYPPPVESAFGQDGRPLEPAFYMRTPAYFNLIYEIYEQSKILEDAEIKQLPVGRGRPETSRAVGHSLSDMQDGEDFPAAASFSSEDLSASPGDQNTVMEDLPSQSDLDLLTGTDGVDSDAAALEDAFALLEQLNAPPDADLNVEFGAPPSPVGEGQVPDAVWPLPSLPPPMEWISKTALSTMLSEDVTDEKYNNVMTRLKSLANHPQNHLVKQFLDRFRKPVESYLSQLKQTPLDDQAVSSAYGWRKTSVANVQVQLGNGRFTVNKRPLIEYFTRLQDRNQVLYPLVVTDLLEKYDVMASVKGGGLTGQAGAVRLGLSKALAAFPGVHSCILESEGLLVRDPRMVERKKPGQLKARKKFAWVKR